MTALLSCDGCGTIVSDRPEDEDPTGTWWSLSASPVIGGGLFRALPSITSVTQITFGEGAEDLDVEEPEPEEDPLPPPDPDRHFCSIECIGAWVARREAP